MNNGDAFTELSTIYQVLMRESFYMPVILNFYKNLISKVWLLQLCRYGNWGGT
jgi:hypothetical protein